MAVKVTRTIPFGAGSRGFRFRNHPDPVADRRQYEEGCALEEARFDKGSLAQRIYRRLSSERTSEERPSERAIGVNLAGMPIKK